MGTCLVDVARLADVVRLSLEVVGDMYRRCCSGWRRWCRIKRACRYWLIQMVQGVLSTAWEVVVLTYRTDYFWKGVEMAGKIGV